MVVSPKKNLLRSLRELHQQRKKVNLPQNAQFAIELAQKSSLLSGDLLQP
jgi:urease accessory protein UreE